MGYPDFDQGAKMLGVVKFLSDTTLRKTAGSVPIVENKSQKMNNAFFSLLLYNM